MQFYVSSSSTVGGATGTQAAPFKTLDQLSAAMGSINPGDTVSFKRGDTFIGVLEVTRSGTSGNPITFNSYGDPNADAPKFIGKNGITVPYLFWLNNRNYIVFDGLEVSDPNIDIDPLTNPSRQEKAYIQRAFSFLGTSNHNTVIRTKVSGAGVGVYIVGSTNTVTECDMSDLMILVDTPGGFDDYGSNPIVIESSANNTITKNNFARNWSHSYDFVLDGGAIELFGNGADNNYIAFNVMEDNIGITEFTGTSTGNKYHYNLMVNNGSVFYLQNSGISSVEFYNNTVIENKSPRLVGETRLFGGQGGALTSGNILMKNNIFFLSNGEKVANAATGITHENNIYKVGGSSTVGFTLDASEQMETGVLFTDTTNSNPVYWNLNAPTSTSRAVNFGQNLSLTQDIHGNPIVGLPDAGAFERVVAGNPLVITATPGTITCNGGTTTVTVSATGGSGTYTGTGTFTVIAGTYSYTVRDSAGASAAKQVTVTEPAAIAATATIDGSTVVITAGGGTAPLTFALDGGSYGSGNIFIALATGSHSVNVKDANNCIKTVTFSIAAGNPVGITLTANRRASCNGGTNGYVTVKATGGQAPYSFSINGSAFYQSSNNYYTFRNLAKGDYLIKVRDSLRQTATLPTVKVAQNRFVTC